MNLRSVTSRRPFRIVLFTGFVLFLLQHFQLVPWGGRSYDTWSWTACPGLSPFSVLCTASRSSIAHDVQVVVKTGGSEQQSRLKFLLKTILKEVPKQNVIIFSDLAEVVDDFQVYDIYTDVSKTERNSYEDFKLYDQQQVYKAEGKDTRTLEGGWALDKYKNLPMKRRLWQMQQDGRMSKRKWFLFIDTDTWIEWDNLFAFLEHLNPSKELYMGSPVWQDTIFAHGGSGYVLSYAALEALNTRKQEEFGSPFFSQYGVDVPNLCCGDWALAQALKDRGIHIKGYWPMFNGEIAATMSYDSEHWCEPVISLHHIGEESLEQFWQWVAAWRMRTANKVHSPNIAKNLHTDYVNSVLSSSKTSSNTSPPTSAAYAKVG